MTVRTPHCVVIETIVSHVPDPVPIPPEWEIYPPSYAEAAAYIVANAPPLSPAQVRALRALAVRHQQDRERYRRASLALESPKLRAERRRLCARYLACQIELSTLTRELKELELNQTALEEWLRAEARRSTGQKGR